LSALPRRCAAGSGALGCSQAPNAGTGVKLVVVVIDDPNTISTTTRRGNDRCSDRAGNGHAWPVRGKASLVKHRTGPMQSEQLIHGPAGATF